MAASVTIRAATPEDTEDVARVHVVTWQRAYRGQVPDDFLDALSIERRAEAWRQWWAEGKVGDQELFVAEVADAVVGFINVGGCRDDDGDAGTGEVRAIYVLPDHLGSRGRTSLDGGRSRVTERPLS